MAQNGVSNSDIGGADSTASERTPLLTTKDVAPTAVTVSESTIIQGSGMHTPVAPVAPVAPVTIASGARDDDKPLPKWQIFWLSFGRMVESMVFFSIFPYINQMAQENGHLADADVGFYSGLIESLFSVTQACVMIFWGRAADRLGRKPVLVFSLVGVTITTSIFGLAKTIWEMILFRCAAGVFAGTLVTIRTMLAELSTPRTQAVVFSWFAFAGNLGIFLGPLLGGALADPATQYPGAFGQVEFFHDYPYALSSFVVGLLSLLAVLVSILFVQETLKKEPSSESSESGTVKPRGDSVLEIVRAPEVRAVLYMYGHIMALAFAYTAIVSVFWFTPVHLGGYGLSPLQISVMMAINGISQATWLLLLFPPLQHRLGTKGVLRGCAMAYPFFFLICPLGNVLLRAGADKVFWVLILPLMVLGSGVSMSFTAIQLALNDVSPDPKALGTLNAISLTGMSLVRGFTPALFTSLFALGARTQWLWGHAIWVLMFMVALPLVFLVKYIPDRQKEGGRGS